MGIDLCKGILFLVICSLLIFAYVVITRNIYKMWVHPEKLFEKQLTWLPNINDQSNFDQETKKLRDQNTIKIVEHNDNQIKSNYSFHPLSKYINNNKKFPQSVLMKIPQGDLSSEIEYDSSSNQVSQEEFKQLHYIIKIDSYPRYTHMVFQENEIYYGQFSNIAQLDKNGFGFHYKVNYDQNMNPKYEIYEGNHLHNKRHGEGILYAGKSTNIVFSGQWHQYEQQKIEKQKLQEAQNTNNPPGKKQITIMENGQIINNLSITRVFPKLKETWVKYNQQITDNDIRILNSKNGWFTSSIIDSFSLYLNIEEEKQFLNINDSQKQRTYDRVLILPSDLFTSMHENTPLQNREIFEKHLLEYSPINFKINIVFQRVLLVINNKNVHWLLAKVDFMKNTLYILDSMKKGQGAYLQVFEIVKAVFQLDLTLNVADTFQQNNGYDCGPCTCLNMLNETNLKIDLAPKKTQSIRKFLYQLLQKQ